MKKFSIKFFFGISILLFVLSCEKESKNIPAKDFYLPAKGKGYIPDDPTVLPIDTTKPCKDCYPKSVDLTPYLPPVGNQKQTGTCVAWAVGYYMKTTLDAIARNTKTAQHNNGTIYSPKDLFFSVPLDKRGDKKGDKCQGTYFAEALKVLIARGIATWEVVPFEPTGDCMEKPSDSWTKEAIKHKIKAYNVIVPQNSNFVALVKQRLSEKRPLVFGANIYDNFGRWRGSNVMTINDAGDDGSEEGGHAMTIVGYDDSKNAFRIVNSWDVTWGDSGFAWVSYELMANPKFCQAVYVPY